MVDGAPVRRQAGLELAELEMRPALPHLIRGGSLVDGIGFDGSAGVHVGTRGGGALRYEYRAFHAQPPQFSDQAFEVDLRPAYSWGGYQAVACRTLMPPAIMRGEKRAACPSRDVASGGPRPARVRPFARPTEERSSGFAGILKGGAWKAR